MVEILARPEPCVGVVDGSTILAGEGWLELTDRMCDDDGCFDVGTTTATYATRAMTG